MDSASLLKFRAQQGDADPGFVPFLPPSIDEVADVLAAPRLRELALRAQAGRVFPAVVVGERECAAIGDFIERRRRMRLARVATGLGDAVGGRTDLLDAVEQAVGRHPLQARAAKQLHTRSRSAGAGFVGPYVIAAVERKFIEDHRFACRRRGWIRRGVGGGRLASSQAERGDRQDDGGHDCGSHTGLQMDGSPGKE